MTRAPLVNVPVHLVTGFLGSGKSSLIRGLIAQKPARETWAVLINEFGQVGIDQAMFDAQSGVVVKGLPGGCLCCQLAFVLQATLVNLLHRHRPDRLIIEPSGLGHPAGLLDVLRGEAFQDVLDIRDIIAVLDPRRLDEPRVRDHETFRDQLAMADAMVLTMGDLASAAQLEAGRRWAAGHWPPPKWVAEAEQGRLPLSLLLEGESRTAVRGAEPGSVAHRALREAAGRVVQLDDFALAVPPRGQPRCEAGEALGYATLGWRWHPDDVFDLDALSHRLDGLPGGVRAKGVFHTADGWKLYNRSGGAIELRPSQWRQDSRLELIAPAGALPEAAAMEAALAGCLVTGAS
ncbi:GTP-binding protein [Billgrantia azerbaijanica]|nr:GTP-binding protein [Halomonas azerbaijanica]